MPSTSRRTRIVLSGLLGGAPVAILALLRLDPILALVVGMLAIALGLAVLLPLSGWRLWLVTCSTIMLCAAVSVRWVSTCHVVRCSAAPWEVQQAIAQQAIDQVGPGFYLVDVWARTDTNRFYRTNQHFQPTRLVMFFFAHAKTRGSPIDAPILYYTVELNDHDPAKSIQIVSGVSYRAEPTAEWVAPALQTIRISPTEAVDRVNAQLHAGDPWINPLVTLQIPTTASSAPTRAIWRIQQRVAATTQYVFVDAHDGTILPTTPPELLP